MIEIPVDLVLSMVVRVAEFRSDFGFSSVVQEVITVAATKATIANGRQSLKFLFFIVLYI